MVFGMCLAFAFITFLSVMCGIFSGIKRKLICQIPVSQELTFKYAISTICLMILYLVLGAVLILVSGNFKSLMKVIATTYTKCSAPENIFDIPFSVGKDMLCSTACACKIQETAAFIEQTPTFETDYNIDVANGMTRFQQCPILTDHLTSDEISLILPIYE